MAGGHIDSSLLTSPVTALPRSKSEENWSNNVESALLEGTMMRLWKRMTLDEKRSMVEIYRRCDRGREKYGELDLEGSNKSWPREAQEEDMDRLVYIGFESLKRLRRLERSENEEKRNGG